MASMTNNYSNFPDELYTLTHFEDADDSLTAFIQRIDANMKLGNYDQVRIDLDTYRSELNSYTLDSKFLNKFEEELRNVELYSGAKQQGIQFSDDEPFHLDADTSWWHMDETSRIALAVPVVYSVLVYNGLQQTASTSPYNTNLIRVTNLTGTAAGTYYAVATLLQPDRYSWKDGSSEDKLIPWSIIRAPGDLVLSTTAVTLSYSSPICYVHIEQSSGLIENVGCSNPNIEYYYDEENEVIVITNPDQIDCSASIIVEMAESENYKESSATIFVDSDYSSLVIVPTIYGNLTYNGQEQSPTISSYDDSLIRITGVTATDVGSYTATISLIDPNHYVWEDGTTETKYAIWSINKATLDIPSVFGGLIYNGQQQTATVSSYDTSLITVTGITGTNAGTYNAIASLIDSENYMWSDKTSSNKQIPWIIQKAPGNITLSTRSVELNKTATSATVTATNATGTFSAYPTDSKYISVSYTSNQITITAVLFEDYNTTVSVVVEETTNYERFATTINVSLLFPIAKNIYGVKCRIGKPYAFERTDAASSFGGITGATDAQVIPCTGSTVILTGSSPFDNIEPWASMTRIENSKAGSLVRIPKYYYKWTTNTSENYYQVQISSEWQSGFSVSPAHANRGDGQGERDFVYVGRYHCSNGLCRSLSGVKPQVSKTRSDFRSSIHALGSSIWQWDNAMLWTILMLYLVETGRWGSGADSMGAGCSNGGALENTGLTDNLRYCTGTTSTVTGYGHVQYRFIEDLWANARDWLDGIYFVDEKVYGINNPANFSDNSGGTYLGNRGKLTAGSTLFISNWISSTTSGFEYTQLPSAATTTETTGRETFGVYQYNANGTGLAVGKDYVKNIPQAHMTNYYSNYPSTGAYTTVSSRLMLLPARGEIVDDGGTPAFIEVPIPTVSGNLSYNGQTQSPTISQYDTNVISATGTSGVNAGSYTATFTLKDKVNYRWSDGTNTDKTKVWSIVKGDAYVTLSTTNVTLDNSHKTVTVSVSAASGTIGVSSVDTSIAAVSISNSTITIASVNDKSGVTNVVVSIGESTNYKSGTQAIGVTAEFSVAYDEYKLDIEWKQIGDSTVSAQAPSTPLIEINGSDILSITNNSTDPIKSTSWSVSQKNSEGVSSTFNYVLGATHTLSITGNTTKSKSLSITNCTNLLVRTYRGENQNYVDQKIVASLSAIVRVQKGGSFNISLTPPGGDGYRSGSSYAEQNNQNYMCIYIQAKDSGHRAYLTGYLSSLPGDPKVGTTYSKGAYLKSNAQGFSDLTVRLNETNSFNYNIAIPAYGYSATPLYFKMGAEEATGSNDLSSLNGSGSEMNFVIS